MKYKTIDELDQAIERRIKRKVQHYYTDWKNYDRPRYMRYKGSNARQDKEIIIIARECGTYIYTVKAIQDAYQIYKEDNDRHTFKDWEYSVYDYYADAPTEGSEYLYINLNTLELKKIEPKQFFKDRIAPAYQLRRAS